MDEVKLRYFRYALYKCDGNKSEVARQIGISIRTARNYYNELFEKKMPVLPEKKDFEIEWNFPTNEERLAHLDR